MRSTGLFVALVTAAGCRDPATVSISTRPDDELVLTIEVRDRTPADALTVSAVSVHVDGQPAHDVLIVPGSGRTSYDTLVGPLSAGQHTVRVTPSKSWPEPRDVVVTSATVSAVAPDDSRYEMFRRAPAVVLRSDTVGTANDLPVLMYVEDRRPSDRTLGYTTIFTNEDGGTDTKALFARWGRACDIEETYVVRFHDNGSPAAETFQGPEHKIITFNGHRIGQHPVLMVATRNNMFVDREAAGVMIRPVPVVAGPNFTTRESVLDERPWIQRLSQQELAAEQKPFDPRDFVYLDANVQVGESAAAAAWIEQADGTRVSSDRGDERLTVTRDGWVRVAVPLGRDASVSAAGWSCLPRKGQAGPCQIQPGRIFRLSSDFQVQKLPVEARAP
jgi:hypothetical protein